MTPHNEAKKGEIARTVLMPGDPMRAKYIAEKYLDNVKLVNTIRAMYAYTGTYKGKEVTVMGHGMGMASIGIYAYELYKFYDVEEIIRIGTSGTHNKDIKLLDVILADRAYSLSKFALQFNDDDVMVVPASSDLNEHILDVANGKNIDVKCGQIVSSDVFDVYVDKEKFLKHMPKDDYLAVEMEAYALFYLAGLLNKKAACLLTVVDSMYDKTEVSAKDRETSLDKMIELALDSIK